MTAHSRFTNIHTDELRCMDDVRMPLGGVPIHDETALLEDTAVAVIHWYGAGPEQWEIADIEIGPHVIGQFESNPVLKAMRREVIDYIDGGKSPTLASQAAYEAWEAARS